MLALRLALLALLPFTLATPIPGSTHVLAGGPIAKPIPPTCILTSPLSSNATATMPSPAFAAAHQLYAYYLPTDSTIGKNASTLLTTCAEQCYGYGNPRECVSVFMASEVPYVTYGVPGVGTACLMFGAELGVGDFVAATNASTYRGPMVVDINCP